MKLFAFVKRREGMSREDFLHHWHHHHGPLIRDTPGLGDRTVRYEQHPARADDRSGWDGVAVQEFASWGDFVAMLGGDAGAAMRADEANFLDPSSIRVVFTDDPVVVTEPDATKGGRGDREHDGDGGSAEHGDGASS
ncbi:hypothetical protein BH23ACT2_BH23ACT2_06960 [soil metagenome]